MNTLVNGQSFFCHSTSSNIQEEGDYSLLAFPKITTASSTFSISFHHYPDLYRNFHSEFSDNNDLLSENLNPNLSPDNTTLLWYQLASKNSQRLHLLHRQAISSKSKLKIAADFGSTKGYYPFQSQNFKYFNPQIEQSFFKERYFVQLGYEAVTLKRDENGGLKDSNGFISNTTTDVKTVAVRMNDAFSEFHLKSFKLEQRFRVPLALSDSGPTTDRFTFSNITFLNRGKERFTTGRNYNDLFMNSFLDTSSTKDSVQLSEIINQTSAEYNINSWFDIRSEKREIYLLLDGTFQLTETLRNGKPIPLFRIFHLEPGLGWRTDKINARIYVNTALGSRLNFGLGGGADIGINLQSSLLSFSVSLQDSCPPLFYFHTYSNHFIWERDYQTIRDFMVHLNYQKDYSRLKLISGIRAHHWKNHHYLNSDSEPEVFQDAISQIQFSAGVKYQLRNWRINAETKVQHSSHTELIRQPGIVQLIELFFEDSVFRAKAWFKTGPGFRYVSGYTLPAFNPALQEFYIKGENSSKGFFQLHYYAQLTIKQSEIYFAVEHLNAGWGNRNYFYALDYPLAGRMIKFGIRWMLEN
jgi:hypothetical protein